ncbi:MAG: SDR family NAD(P)-dependent oxidoreductase [Parasporobacterium sp.]|nr:SDR family NAD(P)-dependent oxidoreductase [Parasporobacterium sp.]
MKHALITGVSGGMGNAAARQLLSEGYTVYGLDLKEPEPTEGLVFIKTDLTDKNEIERAFEFVRSLTKSLDCIINLAGIYDLHSLVEISEEALLKIFQVNLFAVCRVNKTFLPLLRRGGRIMITSSELATLDPLPFTGIYAVTKTALDRYAYSLRMELQLLDHQVIVLRPGAVDTGLLDDSMAALHAFCENTRLYPVNAGKFQRIVKSIETRNIPPEKIACIISKALSVKHPKLVYKVNRNPLLLIMNALPDRLQLLIIKKLLR